MILDPEQVKTWFWRPLIDGELVDGLQISLDGGEAWDDMTTGENEAGDEAYQWTFAGYAVDEDEAEARADTQVTIGRTRFIVRDVDNPEIEPARFYVDCY